MFQLDKFTIDKVEEKKDYGKYEIGPLPSGYGVTMGNVLRRILLSSVPGAAVTSVKIDGVRHEYAALSGVQDDILQILMRIKNLAVISHSDEPQVIKISAKGKKVVTAKDIELTSEVEIPDPDYVITELTTTKAKLDAELTVERNEGYALANEEKRKELGLIPVDADFNPVKRVATRIEKTRVGQETNLDKIVLEVYTNGAVNPWNALAHAVHNFLALAKRMNAIFAGEVEDEIEEEKQAEKIESAATELSLDKLNLSTRLYNTLEKAGYTDLADLAGKSRQEVTEIPRMGEKSVNELFDIMKKYKIDLSDDE